MVSYIEGIQSTRFINGEWHTYMSYQGYHVRRNNISRYYWPAYHGSVGAAPWLKTIRGNPIYWNYNP